MSKKNDEIPKTPESPTLHLKSAFDSIKPEKLDDIDDEDAEINTISIQFMGVLDTLGTLRSQITQIQNQIRTVERVVKKSMKSLKKEAGKHKTKGNRKPSGFAKPSKISPQLCTFMNKNTGDEVARTEVTQYLIQYIKDQNLPDPENKKIIKPDDKLTKLLECGTQEVTYFNLQKFMNKHFLKE
jgi:chromatin remodeling complex protein RSC6